MEEIDILDESNTKVIKEIEEDLKYLKGEVEAIPGNFFFIGNKGIKLNLFKHEIYNKTVKEIPRMGRDTIMHLSGTCNKI